MTEVKVGRYDTLYDKEMREDQYRSDLELLRLCFRNQYVENELASSKTSVKILVALIGIIAILAITVTTFKGLSNLIH